MAYEKYVSRKTVPTTCKFCRKRVFYHTNEYGSKVFFDELGGSWPVHECDGYLMSKSMKGIYYSGISGKTGIPLTGIRMASKPKAILIKKKYSVHGLSFADWV